MRVRTFVAALRFYENSPHEHSIRFQVFGERLSARLLASALRELNIKGVAIDATALIVTDGAAGRAEPLINPSRDRTKTTLEPVINNDGVPVVTGFIGASEKGTLTTLGRGGSDYSATVLAAALNAEEVIIWTDVDVY